MKKIYPFKFLDSYTKDDTNIFFGRDEEINALYEMVFQTDILLVYGASGTGKTSLIQCGLASKFESHDWLALSIRRGNNINESLDKVLLEAAGNEIRTEMDWLSGMNDIDEKQVLVQPASKLELRFRAVHFQYFRPIYLIFDQLEEIFILGNREEQDEFIENVLEILKIDQPVKMIFSIREEYLGHLDRFEKAVPELLRKKLRVEPMNFEKVTQVIQGATHADNSVVSLKKGEESLITEKIFDKVRGGQKTLTIELPYMQVFLDKLYLDITKDEKRNTEAEFSLSSLDKIGDIGDVLREFIEEQVTSISQSLINDYPDASPENIWKILSPFVTLEGTKEPNSKINIRNRLPGINESLIDKSIEAFVKRRILKESEIEGMYEITHDSLAERIAERRSVEENTLLEIVRLIKSQTALKDEARELFSQKQLNYIEEFLDKLREQKLIDDEGEALIEQSRLRIKQLEAAEIEEKERELKEANARAEKESALRKDAETAQEKAVHSEKRAKVRSRYAAIAAVIAVLIAGAAIYFYIAANKEKQNTKIALDKADKLIETFYFYDDHLALASRKEFGGETKFGFINKEGDAVINYKYDKADQFDNTGFAKVIRDSTNYLVDTKGNEYRVSYKLSGLTEAVTALDLRDTTLKTFPEEVLAHTKLKVLILENSDFESLPSAINRLQNLKVLFLNNDSLNEIPKEISELSSLQRLNLSGNQLTGLPPEIGNLKSLEVLNLSGNRLTSLPPEIGQLKALLNLDLRGNQFSDLPSEFWGLDSLKELSFSENKFTSLPPGIGELKSLQLLYLNANQLTNLPAEIGQLRSLKKLDLVGNKLANLPSEIEQLKSLQSLNLSGNQFSNLPSGVFDLDSLKEITLSGNQLTGLSSDIGQLKNLKKLDLVGNQLTGLPKEIGQLNSLLILFLDSNKLNTLIPEIRELKSLQRLGLSGNQLTKLPSELGQLNSLQMLILFDNKLTDIPPEIGQLNSLKRLILSQNQLTSLPPEIGKLNSLQKLYLNNNQLTNLPQEIVQLSSLQDLDLSDNKWTNLPPEIAQLKDLRWLFISQNNLSDADKESIRNLLPNCRVIFTNENYKFQKNYYKDPNEEDYAIDDQNIQQKTEEISEPIADKQIENKPETVSKEDNTKSTVPEVIPIPTDESKNKPESKQPEKQKEDNSEIKKKFEEKKQDIKEENIQPKQADRAPVPINLDNVRANIRNLNVSSVDAKVLVDVNGSVIKVDVIKPKEFEDEVSRALRMLRFEPGFKDGKEARVYYRIRF